MRRRWPLLIVAALVVAGGAYGAQRWLAADKKPAPPPTPVPVSAAAAKTADVAVYLRGLGTVQALNTVEIHPQVGGVLVSVPVNEGQEVEKGAVLAVIDPRPFQAALDRAQAQRKEDTSQLENAHLDLNRYSALVQRDFASRQQVDTQQSSVARLEGVVAADDADITTAQINLGYTVIHAPFDGRVGLRRVDPGNLLQANMTGPGILTLVQDRPIYVVFTLPETEVPQVHDAMAKGTLPVLADKSDGTVQLAAGTLATLDNTINQSSGTIQLKALFPNGDGALVPGQFVSVRLQVMVAHGVTIPHTAVQHGQDNLFVFAVKPDKTVEQRTIKIAYDDGERTVIAEGVRDGEQVVTSGQSRIGTGTSVAVNGGDDEQTASR